MRLSPPHSLKLDQESLLAEVRDRLTRRLPGDQTLEPDPTDPGWLVLEEAAWIAETLSTQLSAWPYAAIRQVLHLMGGQLRPAHPALGVLVVQPSSSGTLNIGVDRPPLYRFFAGQTETRPLVEFCPIEPSLDLRPARVENISAWWAGELWCLGTPPADGMERQLVAVAPRQRSRLFDQERIDFVAITTTPEETDKRLTAAVQELIGRKVDWLALKNGLEDNKVRLTAWVSPDQALRNAVPEGIWSGGDLEFEWGPLDDSTWVPPVRISLRPEVPQPWQGRPPMPGRLEGTLRIPSLPARVPIEGLLERGSSPMPSVVVESIWKNIASIDAELGRLNVRAARSIDPAPGEPTWPVHALRSGQWANLTHKGDTTFIQISLDEARSGRLRLALVLPNNAPSPAVRAWAIDPATGVLPTSLNVDHTWSIALPDNAPNPRLFAVFGLDIATPAEAKSLLVAVNTEILAVWLNAILIANAPPVRDGRRVEVKHTTPEAVNLLQEDVVTTEVIHQLSAQPLSNSVRHLLTRLPLAWFDLPAGGRIRDFRGIQVDPSAGQLLLNAPDTSGEVRNLRPGSALTLQWYRSTNGAEGEVEPGAIRFSESPPEQRPGIVSVINPLRTFYGQSRESDQQCLERLFTKGAGVPVLAADWEHAIRQSLGSRTRDWHIRCWTYTERSLLAHVVWPVADEDAERIELMQQLDKAGPDVLYVVLGPTSEVLSDADLAWARQGVTALVENLRRRFPTIRGTVVSRFWPLKVTGPSTEALPSHDGRHFSGTAADPQGRSARVPGVLMLNAAVVEVGS